MVARGAYRFDSETWGARARRTRYVQLQESKHPSGKGLPGVEEKQSFSRYRGRRGSSPANSPYMIQTLRSSSPQKVSQLWIPGVLERGFLYPSLTLGGGIISENQPGTAADHKATPRTQLDSGIQFRKSRVVAFCWWCVFCFVSVFKNRAPLALPDKWNLEASVFVSVWLGTRIAFWKCLKSRAVLVSTSPYLHRRAYSFLAQRWLWTTSQGWETTAQRHRSLTSPSVDFFRIFYFTIVYEILWEFLT